MVSHLRFSSSFKVSRYLLGNALTSKYFSYSNDMKDLFRALSAYLRSESEGGTCNPDLYYNRGMVLQYMLDYANALQAYHTACTIDKMLYDARRLFNELHAYILKLNSTYSEQIVFLNHNPRFVNAFANAYPGSIAVTELKNGSNKKHSLIVKILADVVHSTPPYNYMCMDTHGNTVLLCFYNIADGIRYFKVENTVVVKNPHLLERKGSTSQWDILRNFPIIQIFDLKDVTVDNQPVPDDVIVPTVLKSILLSEDNVRAPLV